MTDDERTAIGRTPTEVPGLDDVLGGGLFVGGVYLIAGRPGAGKTLLSNQIAFNHTSAGGRALYVTLLAESHARMLALMEPMRFFQPNDVGSSLQYLSGYRALEKDRLSGLVQLLRTAVRDHRATLLIVDGLLTAHDLAETDIDLKKFVHEVQLLAELAGCTTLLLRGAHDVDESYPERTMADGLILLAERRVGMRSVREIEIQKHRGGAHVLGSSFFTISTTGITIFPRTESRVGLEIVARDHSHRELVSTGVASLDRVLHGGLPRDSATVLLGTPGSGKTLLGLHFLDAGARVGERSLYVGFSEQPSQILDKATSIGIDLAAHVQSGRLEVQWRSPQEPLADELASLLFDIIRRDGIRRVFVDGFEGIQAGLIYPERLRPFAISLVNELRARRVTAVLSAELSASCGNELAVPPGATEIVDNIIFMRNVELATRTEHRISVMKMRDHKYDTTYHGVRIAADGVQVGPSSERGRTKGKAKPSRRAKDRG